MKKIETEKLGWTPDRSVERALEQKPAVRVPEGFAARVAAQAVVQSVGVPLKTQVRRMGMSRVAAVVAMVMCAVVLFVAAPRVGNHYASWPFAVEMLALVQMAGIAWGLVVVRGNR